MVGGMAPLEMDVKHPEIAIEKILASVVQGVQPKMHSIPVGLRWVEKLPFSNE